MDSVVVELLRVSELLEAATVISARGYEYALSRSLNKGGAPAGYSNRRKANKLITWKFRHGIVRYSKPLTEDQIITHKLIPLSANDPAVQESAINLLHSDVMDQLVATSVYETSIKKGNSAQVAYDSDGAGTKWYLKTFNRVGNEIGKKLVRKTVNGISSALWNMLTDKRKKTYLDIILYDI